MRLIAARRFGSCALVASLGAACSERGAAPEDRANASERALVSAAAPLAPTVGPEFDLGQPLVDTQTAAETKQAVASNASGVALVVWAVNNSSYSAADVYGARIAPGGELLDPEGIPIGTGPLEETSPAVASDGSGWFVAWSGAQANTESRIFGARVTSAGEVLDPTGIPIATSDAQSRQPSVASDGTNYLVTWASSGSWTVPTLHGARIAPDGSVLDPNSIVVTAALTPWFYETPWRGLAFDGTDWLAVWNSPTLGGPDLTENIYGTRISSAGALRGSFLISNAAGNQISPAISCRGPDCFVAWQSPDGIAGARVSGGAVLDSGGIVIAPGSSPPRRSPEVAWDGSNWVTAWMTGYYGESTLDLARISTAGVLLDTTPLSIAAGDDVTVDQSSERALLAWSSSYESGRQTHAAFIDDGSPTASFVVSRALLRSPGFAPAAAASNTNSLVVWEDRRDDGSQNVYGTRVSPSGAILDPQGIRLSFPDSYALLPQVASDGTNWLLVWGDRHNADNSDIYGRRVGPDGEPLDTEPKLIASGEQNQLEPHVAFNGTSWLVTWGSDTSTPNPATRVALDGTVLDPSGIPIGVRTRVNEGVIAGGGGQWLAVGRPIDPVLPGLGIYGQRLADDGTLLDQTPFTIAVPLDGTPSSPAVAYGGGHWLVTWTFEPDNGSAHDVQGVRVSASGEVLDSDVLPITSNGTAGGGYAAYDGTDWLVAWSDWRSWWSPQNRLFGTPGDIYGARVTSDGVLLEPNGFAIAAGAGGESLQALTGGKGRWLSVYSMNAGPDAGLRARIIENACKSLGSTDANCDGVDDDCDGTPDDDFTPTSTMCGAGACAATGTTSCVSGTVHDSCVPDATDSDGDGVPDCMDACPSLPGTQADGCPETGEGGSGGEGGGGEGGSAGTGALGGMFGTGGDGGMSGTGASGGMSGTGGHGGMSGTGASGGIAATGGHGGISGAPGEAGQTGEAGEAGQAGEAGYGGTSGTAGRGGTPGTAGHGGTANAGRGGRSSTAGHGGISANAGEAGGGGAPAGGTHDGGRAGRGGSAGRAGSASGHAGTSSQPPPSNGEGCGCSVPTERSSMPWSLGLGLFGAAAAVRRRRRAP